MQRLSSLDASFLALDGPHGAGHICLTALVAGRLDLDELRDLVEARLPFAPILRRRLRNVPLGIDRPWWVDDPDFDLTQHLFGSVVIGDEWRRELARTVAQIAEQPLDRSRPLWEIHLVQGSAPDQTAVITKIHHAAVDGIAGRDLLTTLLDDRPPETDPSSDGAWHPASLPGTGEMLARGMLGVADLAGTALRLEAALMGRLPQVPTLAITSAARVSSGTVEWLTGTAGDAVPVRSRPRISAPRTPFNKAITRERAWAFGELSLDDSKAVRTAAGATVNDVLLSTVAGALREWLLRAEALPEEPLRALVPISVRTDEDKVTGNKIDLMTCPLPTDVADPLVRLTSVRETTAVAKAHRAIGADTLQDVASFAPPALATRAVRVVAAARLADRVRLPFNVLVSNVPGTREVLHLHGQPIEGLYPLPALSDGLGLNITIQGYRGRLHVGVVTCPALIPDPWEVLDLLVAAHDELVEQGRLRATHPSQS
jgi:WS/DGAT/MGAT family acyltransferase